MSRTPLENITEAEKQLLWERAQKLIEHYLIDPSDNKDKYLLFQLSNASFAIDGRCVREVLKLPQVTVIPCCPSFVSGVINVRGHLTSVLDLSAVLGLSHPPSSGPGWAIILASPEHEFAVRVDSISDITLISPEEIQPLPAIFTGLGATFALGLWKEQTIVLDGAQLLADEHFVVSESVEL